MIRLAPVGVIATTLCGWSFGQTSAVIPSANTIVEGNSLDQEPFGFNQITHLQYIDRSALTAVPSGASLNRIEYRRDWASTAGTATMTRVLRGVPAPAIWEIWMINYLGPVQNPTNVITRTGWSNVMTPILVNFPDLPRGAGPTANFTLSFAFDFPLLYNGGNLGVSHVAYEANGGTFNYLADGVVSAVTAGSAGRISPTALGCPAEQNRCEGAAPNPGAGNLEFYLYGGKPSSTAVAYLGTNTTTWLGSPLPLNLGFMGLGACSVYTDLVVPMPRVTNTVGNASAIVPVPGDPALTSATLFGQWVLRDDRVNPAVDLATSDGLRFTFGPAVGGYSVPMSVVSAGLNLARGRTGFVRPGEGLIFRLSW